ncbi:phage tail assembly chaperone [Methylobacterium indicum]|uniref:Uncharacterized protein n=1 Tax=Methylobacterium indicum TaxID=1775910 RepID=A0ABR5GZC4_9HYPH|nr:hypothetical protein [Methylobacterium indicum]KMO15772.1 hypothetical protein QR79_23840 [Methylobacterium indicum]KMO18048.1 hypothetical protein QR78_16185 [Methylobacterium indicum]
MHFGPMHAHIARLKAEGRKLPDGYDERPGISAFNLFFWDAFWELSTERPLGFGAEGRIPGSAIEAFAGRVGMVDTDEIAFFRAVMRGMDAEYLARKPWVATVAAGGVAMNDHKGLRGLLRRNAKAPTGQPHAGLPASA